MSVYTDGVAFVALAPLRTAAEVPSAVLHALGVLAPIGDHRAMVLHVLRERHMLLVLDNVEHLLDSADLITDMLQAAPRVAIIATSREPLNLRGEQRYVVEGLAYEAAVPDADRADVAAVRLFVHHARRVQPHFRLDTGDLASVLRICALVRGMPLGIELAAAWVELLSTEVLAAQIARGGDFLASDLRDLPERQRSMRAVFDLSWPLLRADEQQLFQSATAPMKRTPWCRSVMEPTVSATTTAPVCILMRHCP